MRATRQEQLRMTRLAFSLTLLVCTIAGAVYGWVQPASASPAPKPNPQESSYQGPDFCSNCHGEIHETWVVGLHANAFSSPIFQRNWAEVGSQFTCLECHTTGFNATTRTYAFEGVTCESCHGPFVYGHPEADMPITPDHELCATCHTTTTNEWLASPHANRIECQGCHDPHAQDILASTSSELCGNCHKLTGDSFSHGTHAGSGLECSDCHMYTSPNTQDKNMGLIPTGHTFTVGSEACIGCHQDTVHTRDVIVELTGEVETLSTIDPEELRVLVKDQEERISDLESRSTVRLYVGLAQGAIVGLTTGAVAAWVISRKIEVVEIEGDRDE
jgi:predicted CXXCH cytochrome family protein